MQETETIEVWSNRVNSIYIKIHQKLLTEWSSPTGTKVPDLTATLRRLLTAPQYRVKQLNPRFEPVVRKCIESRHKFAHQQLRTVGAHKEVLHSFLELSQMMNFRDIRDEIREMLDSGARSFQAHELDVESEGSGWLGYAAFGAAVVAGAAFLASRNRRTDQ